MADELGAEQVLLPLAMSLRFLGHDGEAFWGALPFVQQSGARGNLNFLTLPKKLLPHADLARYLLVKSPGLAKIRPEQDVVISAENPEQLAFILDTVVHGRGTLLEGKPGVN